MEDINYERYEELLGVTESNFYKNTYTVFEKDKLKGIRITKLESICGAIMREY